MKPRRKSPIRRPSTGSARWAERWAQGGPIIERERIDLNYDPGEKMWTAHWFGEAEYTVYWGLTPLIAAMRCFVASKLGDEVDVPDELLT